MFSHLGREGFPSRRSSHENLLDLARCAGLAEMWLDNQAGCKGGCARVPTSDTSTLHDPALRPDGECAGMVMLQGLDARIQPCRPSGAPGACCW